jgi:2-dehydro-3-deoxygluconokinase
VLKQILSQVDLLLCPLSDAETVFGMTGTGEEVAYQFREEFGIDSVVVTCGGDGGRAIDSRGEWSVGAYSLGTVVDRVGAGDAFDAGVLYGYLQGDLRLGMEYGSAMAALKHTVPGDLLIATKAEIELVLQGAGGGIRR